MATSWLKAALEQKSVEMGRGGEITPEVVGAMTREDLCRIGDAMHGRPPGTSAAVMADETPAGSAWQEDYTRRRFAEILAEGGR